MRFQHLMAAATLAAFVVCLTAISTADSQSPKLHQIGVLLAGPAANFKEQLQAVRDRLREDGFVEGQTIKFVEKYAPGNRERLKQFAAELASIPVDVILTSASTSTQSAKDATADIPIVFAVAGDPIASGFAKSLEQPGGNVTGVVNSGPELAGKRVAVLKEAVPSIRRIGIIGDMTPVQQAESKQSIEAAAKRLGIEVFFPTIKSTNDIPAGFAEAQAWGADGYVNVSQTITSNGQEQIGELALNSGRPIVVHTARGAEAGALISLNDSDIDIFRTAGGLISKLLKGSSPATLPIEKASRPELIINLKAARQLKISLPRSLLERATRIIE